MACAAILVAVAIAGPGAAYLRHATGRTAASSQARPMPARPTLAAGTRPATKIPAARLPASGSGGLLLGVDQAGQFQLASVAGTAAPAVLRGVPANTNAPDLIATDPAGGWVITVTAGPANAQDDQPDRLATVSTSGIIRPFGPVFGGVEYLTSLAVRADGSAVAVAVSGLALSGAPPPARIELVSMPGHQEAVRTWTMKSGLAATAESLSWAPGGTRLTYIPGHDASGGGFAGTGAVTMDVTARGHLAPDASGWPGRTGRQGSCRLLAGAWSGGRYLALEQCGAAARLRPVNPADGTPEGPAVDVPWVAGCGAAVVDPGPLPGEVLISGCGLALDAQGHVTRLAGRMLQAAWGGAR